MDVEKEQGLRRELRMRASGLRVAVDGSIMAVDAFGPVARELCESGRVVPGRLRAVVRKELAEIRTGVRQIDRARTGFLREWRTARDGAPAVAAEFPWDERAAEYAERAVARAVRKVCVEAEAILDGADRAGPRARRTLSGDLAVLHGDLKGMEEVIP